MSTLSPDKSSTTRTAGPCLYCCTGMQHGAQQDLCSTPQEGTDQFNVVPALDAHLLKDVATSARGLADVLHQACLPALRVPHLLLKVLPKHIVCGIRGQPRASDVRSALTCKGCGNEGVMSMRGQQRRSACVAPASAASPCPSCGRCSM